MTNDKDNKIKRFYRFRNDNQQEVIAECFEWVADTGGTIIASLTSTFKNSFELKSESEYKKFLQLCDSSNVYLKTIRGGSFIPSGERLLLLFLDEDEVARVENEISSSHNSLEVSEILMLVWNPKWAINWVKLYDSQLIGAVPDDWNEEEIKASLSYEMPEEISKLLEHIGRESKASGNFLDYPETDLLRKDLKEHKNLWSKINTDDVVNKCIEQKIDLKVMTEIVEIFKKSKNSR